MFALQSIFLGVGQYQGKTVGELSSTWSDDMILVVIFTCQRIQKGLSDYERMELFL